MVISRATKKQKEFISGKKKERSSEGKTILLRIPQDTLEKIDSVIDKRSIKIPRNTWLLEAIHEYLKAPPK